MSSIVPSATIESNNFCAACFDWLSQSSSVQNCGLCGSTKFGGTRFRVNNSNAKTRGALPPPMTPSLRIASHEFLAAVMNHDWIQRNDADVIFAVSNSRACRETYLKLQKEIMSAMYGHCNAGTRAIVLTAFAHFSSLTLSCPSENICTNNISAPISPCNPILPLEDNSTPDHLGVSRPQPRPRTHSCTEPELTSSAEDACQTFTKMDSECVADDKPADGKKEREWNSPSMGLKGTYFSYKQLDPDLSGPTAISVTSPPSLSASDTPSPIPPITVEYHDNPLHDVPKITFRQVKTFGESFNDRFLAITGGRDMNDPAVREAWKACNGYHRLRQLLRLVESVQGVSGDEPLSEEHASKFHALSKDIQRLLKSISVTLKVPGRTQAGTFPLEESPKSQSPASTVAVPLRDSQPRRVNSKKNAASFHSSIRGTVPWTQGLVEDQSAYDLKPRLHDDHFQPPVVTDDFVPACSEPRNSSAQIFDTRASKHEACPSIMTTGSMATATDLNEVYQPTPPAGNSSRRRAIFRSYTPTLQLEVSILHEKSAQGSRRLKNMNDMNQYSGSAQAPVSEVPIPLVYDPTLFKDAAEIRNPLRNHKGEIVRFYDSYMTVGGSQNGIIPYLPAGTISLPGSLMMSRPHAM